MLDEQEEIQKFRNKSGEILKNILEKAPTLYYANFAKDYNEIRACLLFLLKIEEINSYALREIISILRDEYDWNWNWNTLSDLLKNKEWKDCPTIQKIRKRLFLDDDRIVDFIVDFIVNEKDIAIGLNLGLEKTVYINIPNPEKADKYLNETILAACSEWFAYNKPENAFFFVKKLEKINSNGNLSNLEIKRIETILSDFECEEFKNGLITFLKKTKLDKSSLKKLLYSPHLKAFFNIPLEKITQKIFDTNLNEIFYIEKGFLNIVSDNFVIRAPVKKTNFDGELSHGQECLLENIFLDFENLLPLNFKKAWTNLVWKIWGDHSVCASTDQHYALPLGKSIEEKSWSKAFTDLANEHKIPLKEIIRLTQLDVWKTVADLSFLSKIEEAPPTKRNYWQGDLLTFKIENKEHTWSFNKLNDKEDGIFIWGNSLFRSKNELKTFINDWFNERNGNISISSYIYFVQCDENSMGVIPDKIPEEWRNFWYSFLKKYIKAGLGYSLHARFAFSDPEKFIDFLSSPNFQISFLEKEVKEIQNWSINQIRYQKLNFKKQEVQVVETPNKKEDTKTEETVNWNQAMQSVAARIFEKKLSKISALFTVSNPPDLIKEEVILTKSNEITN